MLKRHRLEARLQEALYPEMLEVIDESYLHAGHQEAGSAVETHFRVRIKSPAFKGKSRLERHRMVYQAIDSMFEGQDIHALALECLE